MDFDRDTTQSNALHSSALPTMLSMHSQRCTTLPDSAARLEGGSLGGPLRKLMTAVRVATHYSSRTYWHYKDGGSTSVIPELSSCAACVIVRH